MKRLIILPLEVKLHEIDIKNGMSDAADGIITIKDSKHSELVAISKDKTDVTFETPFDLETINMSCELHMYDRQDRTFYVMANKPKIDGTGTATMYCNENGPSVSFHLVNAKS